MTTSQHTNWQSQDVVDVRDAAFVARTYLEQADVRSLLAQYTGTKRLRAACEVGAGYGRMTVLLAEFADQVVGIEREVHFVGEGARLNPTINFVNVESLTALPVRCGDFDLVLTFTVLQHLTDAVVRAVAAEIVRILKPGGYLLICEETNPCAFSGVMDDMNGIFTIGRPVAAYQRLFESLVLVTTKPRRIEPTYPRDDVGTYMLFRKSSDIDWTHSQVD